MFADIYNWWNLKILFEYWTEMVFFFNRKIQVLLFGPCISVGADGACGCELSGCIVHQTLLIAFSDHFLMAHETVWFFNCYCNVKRYIVSWVLFLISVGIGNRASWGNFNFFDLKLQILTLHMLHECNCLFEYSFSITFDSLIVMPLIGN